MHSASAPIANAEDHAALAGRLGRAARAASLTLANVPTERKDAALLRLAALIDASAGTLVEVNARDLAAGAEAGLAPGMLDRLPRTPARLAQMVKPGTAAVFQN